jgi:hypothetical protein
MPRKPEGPRALTAAERRARHRQRQAEHLVQLKALAHDLLLGAEAWLSHLERLIEHPSPEERDGLAEAAREQRAKLGRARVALEK